jgi:hypothetical protein
MAQVGLHFYNLTATREGGPQRVRAETGPSLRDLNHFLRLFPALKRWAKLGRPSGAGLSSTSFRPGCQKTNSHVHAEALGQAGSLLRDWILDLLYYQVVYWAGFQARPSMAPDSYKHQVLSVTYVDYFSGSRAFG